MSSSITVRGFAATQPKFTIVSGGLAVSSFRLGASERRYNRTTGTWENGPTSWYSVSCFRTLASNVYASVKKGDPVIVTGRLKVSEWSAGDKSGLDVEIEAEGVGHDFRWGKSLGFARPAKSKSAGGEDDGAAGADDEQLPPDEQSEPAAWTGAGMEIGASAVEDAGEPAPLRLVAVDEETGEVEDLEPAVTPPF